MSDYERILRKQSKRRSVFLLSLALKGLVAVVMLAALSMAYSGTAYADCNGYTCSNIPNSCYAQPGTCCEDGAYQLGAQCCQGGGACAQGSNCWGSNGGTSICCPAGTQGYQDGGCAPIGISDYCGLQNGSTYYCTAGHGLCTWTTIDHSPSAAKCTN